MHVRSYLVLMAVVIIAPVIVFSGISLDKLLDAHRNTAHQNLMETARSTALAVDQELASAQSALRVLALSRSLQAGDFRTFHEHARIANIASTGWIILYDDKGDQVINTRVPYGAPLATTRDRMEIIQVLEDGKMRTSDLFVGQAVQKPVVMLETPVTLASGKRYVLSQAFLASHFNRAMSGRGTPPSWLIGIFDRNGIIVARSHRADELVGKPIRPTMRQATLAAFEGKLRHKTSDGIDVYDVFTHSRISGWSIAIGAPATEIEAEVRQALFIWAGGLLIAIALAITLAMLIGRRLMRSIANAAESAVLLGNGQALKPLAGGGVIELNRLHAALQNADGLLARERASRTQAEAEREMLLIREQHARRAAEDLNQAKDQFLAMLSHELRNPINAISAAVSVFDLNLPRAATDRAVAVIRRQGLHLRHIIDDLLDVSRAISGKLALKPEQIDLGQSVGRSLDAMTAAGLFSQHQVHVAVCRAYISGDPTRIDQIVSNLVDNAVKYTPPGGRIGITLSIDGAEAVLAVADNGIGIAPELLPKIFDVFVQADRSLDRSQGGLGIGLSLVRELARLHGGSVAAESAGLGQGSRFTLRLPLIQHSGPDNHADTENLPANPAGLAAGILAAGDPAAGDPAAGDPAAGTPVSGSVLLIEDNDDARHLFAVLLASCGMRTFEAENGASGLRMAATERPDFAFIDIGLPEMSGYEVARRMREDPATAGITLIALTGYGMESDRRTALESGFDYHLVKPASLDDLLRVLRSASARQSARQSVGVPDQRALQ
jgi:signal transduction histidine kinase/CheY-like chemotaxis protein